ncbi:hypothetical protein SKA34_17135 [Photobacterium sp. SKA34]|uniref:hypothetical protein n=1 Tax=Photobacterium sp. SKA34 TaxID=121723 RepID=UPI00006BEB0A|nr:hypothetical protein [Photobacterium sp. SKA34]EAR55914.1 hypothetical protein SKA34_17135 [Photobacterium sp. SKA34]
MHQMFLMIGAGERSGSGIPKIYSGWKWANWRVPRLHEKVEPEQTLLELSIVNLVSEETAALLHQKFGSKVERLNELERSIVITAAAEGWVDHERACQLTSLHSRDVTLALPKLVSNGFLISHGEKRDKSYTLPGVELPSPDEVFAVNPLSIQSVITDSEDMITDSGNMNTDNGDMITDKGPDRDELGRFVTNKLPYPYIDDFECLDDQLKQKLKGISEPARDKKRLSNEIMDDIVLNLCRGHFIPLSIIAQLVDRTPQNIREKQLAPLVENGKMSMAFPYAKRHKKQGYITIG